MSLTPSWTKEKDDFLMALAREIDDVRRAGGPYVGSPFQNATKHAARALLSSASEPAKELPIELEKARNWEYEAAHDCPKCGEKLILHKAGAAAVDTEEALTERQSSDVDAIRETILSPDWESRIKERMRVPKMEGQIGASAIAPPTKGGDPPESGQHGNRQGDSPMLAPGSVARAASTAPAPRDAVEILEALRHDVERCHQYRANDYGPTSTWGKGCLGRDQDDAFVDAQASIRREREEAAARLATADGAFGKAASKLRAAQERIEKALPILEKAAALGNPRPVHDIIEARRILSEGSEK